MDGWLREPRDQDRDQDQNWNCQAGLPGWEQSPPLSPVREQPGHCWRVGCRRNTSGTAAVQVPFQSPCTSDPST